MEKQKRYIVIGASIFGVLVIAITLFLVFRLPSEPVNVEEEKNGDSMETESDLALLEEAIQSKIDGTLIKIPEEKMIALIVENHTDSRKQMMGLSQASLVFEAESEGGITRFLAFFPYQYTEKVGPIRSARPYFVKWAEMFNSAFGHAGGSQLGLNAIYTSGRVMDMEALALEGGTKNFTRDYRYHAPHNLYANLKDLRNLMKERKWNKVLEKDYFKFGDFEGGMLPVAEEINIYYPSPLYYVRYEYDKGSGKYLRFIGGSELIDNSNDEQIAVSNVIVMITNYYPYDDVGRLTMTTEGEGDIYLYRDGIELGGKWKKGSGLKFYDNQGEELSLKEGPIWISVVSPYTSFESE